MPEMNSQLMPDMTLKMSLESLKPHLFPPKLLEALILGDSRKLSILEYPGLSKMPSMTNDVSMGVNAAKSPSEISSRPTQTSIHCVTGTVSTHDVMYTGFYF